ncbi:MAG: alanine racemase [Alphaproteobacteria bacterium]|nr:alanine racemase [Alphaproteobacteria bacterium]
MPAPSQTDTGFPTHPAWMEIDLDALAANYAELQRRAGPSIKIIASLKANAYGHGAVATAKTLSGLGTFALSTGSFRDAVAIRDAGITTPIVMFGGNLPDGIADYLDYDLIPTVYNMATAQAVSDTAKTPVPVYIKVDAGMGRLGIALPEADAFIRRVAALPRVIIEGVYTHLSFNDAVGQEWSKRGIDRFNALIAGLRDSGLDIPVTQAVASSNLMVGHMDGSNAICPGHLLYGLPSVAPDLADIAPFQPVLRSVRARLIHIGEFPDDPELKTGGYHVKRQGPRTGVVPLGLYDGYRKPQDGAPAAVLLQGRRLPVLGVSLEHLTFDLLDLDNVAIGDDVVVLGADGDDCITLAELANWQGCRAIDELMNFDGRLPHRYYGST